MYADFRAVDRWTREELHCAFQALVVAVATRHADAVDIKFLVNSRPLLNLTRSFPQQLFLRS